MKKIFMFISFISSISIYSSTVSGFVFLDDQTDHENITITFSPNSPSASYQQINSISDGSFNVDIQNGIYNILYEKVGYQPYEITNLLINNTTNLEAVTLSSRPIIEISGNVNGIWNSGFTYKIIGDITIPENNTLTIEPDVEVKFDDYYSINVFGTLIAEGNMDNYILFTSNKTNPTINDWNKIYFANTTNDTSILNFCIIEYAKMENSSNLGMLEVRSNLDVTNCILRNSGETAIYVNNNGVVNIANNEIYNCSRGIVTTGNNSLLNITNNEIYDMIYIGIHASFISTASTIKCNIIRNCPYAGIQSWSETEIESNIFINNGTGLTLGDGQANVILNTFYDNQYGILLYDSSAFNPTPSINSNLFVENNTAIFSDASTMASEIKYNSFYNNNSTGNNLPNGVETIVTTNINNTPSDSFYNIFVDPEILSFNYTSSDFCVPASSSPLFNAGDPSINGESLSIATNCNSSLTLSVHNENNVNNSFTFYPNPTRDFIKIENEIKYCMILNTNGMVIRSKIESKTIDMRNLPNGLYFLKAVLKDGNIVMKKVIKN